jgi:hypothetical protein
MLDFFTRGTPFERKGGDAALLAPVKDDLRLFLRRSLSGLEPDLETIETIASNWDGWPTDRGNQKKLVRAISRKIKKARTPG